MEVKASFTFPASVPSGAGDIDPDTSLPYARLERDLLYPNNVVGHVAEVTHRTDDTGLPAGGAGPPVRYVFRAYFLVPFENSDYTVLVEGTAAYVKHPEYLDFYVDLADLPGPVNVNFVILA